MLSTWRIPHIYAVAEKTRRIAYVGKDEGLSRRVNTHLRGVDSTTKFMVQELRKKGLAVEFFCLEVDPVDISKAELSWMVRCEKEFDLALFNKHRPDRGEKEYSDRLPAFERMYGEPIPGPWFNNWLDAKNLAASHLFRARAKFGLYRTELDYRQCEVRHDYYLTDLQRSRAGKHFSPQLAELSYGQIVEKVHYYMNLVKECSDCLNSFRGAK